MPLVLTSPIRPTKNRHEGGPLVHLAIMATHPSTQRRHQQGLQRTIQDTIRHMGRHLALAIMDRHPVILNMGLRTGQ